MTSCEARRFARKRLRALVCAAPAAALALLVVGLSAAGPRAARADDAAEAPAEVPLEIMVLRVSDEPGEPDPRAERVDRLLRGQIAYRSLEVVESQERELPLDDVWTFELPTGQSVLVRPIEADESGTLLALDVEGGLQGDFRVRPGQPLILGGLRQGEDKLVLVVHCR